MKEKNEPAIQFLLFEKYPDKVIEDKFEVSSLIAKGYKVYEANKIKQNLPPAREVVDLHMEKLSDNWQHMNNFEILNMQLDEFHKWYELAVAHHRQNLIIIHGVGSGKLRDEIHDILKTKKRSTTSSINTIPGLATELQKFSFVKQTGLYAAC